MTATTSPATSARPAILDQGYLREQSRLESMVGPEWYRLLKGVVTNPLSVIGILIVVLFILMAIFAPILAPPPSLVHDANLIPRDGFRQEPTPPGTLWEKNAPMVVPAWYKALIGEEWIHIMGTTAGQYDIWYGLIWGARTALFAGSFVALASVAIGIIIGALAGYYGGWVDEVLMRVVEIFIAFLKTIKRERFFHDQ